MSEKDKLESLEQQLHKLINRYYHAEGNDKIGIYQDFEQKYLYFNTLADDFNYQTPNRKSINVFYQLESKKYYK
jgi:hypothetical protein